MSYHQNRHHANSRRKYQSIMLHSMRATSFFILLLLSSFCCPAQSIDLDDMPAEIWPPLYYRGSYQRQPHDTSHQQRPTATKWDFGLQNRIESLLCRKLRAANCVMFTKDQKCRIDFELYDSFKIKNVKISSHSEDVRFDQISKDLILHSIGSPELKLEKIQMGKPLKVSSTFHKAGTSRWVVVYVDKRNESAPDRLRPFDYGFKNWDYDSISRPLIDLRRRQLEDEPAPPQPTDRQMIEYKNEFGEKRFKLVPVDRNDQ